MRDGERPDDGDVLRIDCAECVLEGTDACGDCVVTWLVDHDEGGVVVVDLGAAPGGWTWQLVRRGLHVTAVDNGPMEEQLMLSGLVAHKREDGFRFQPRQRVDWMVCDMVEQPRRVAERMADWLAQGWCKRCVFNLKLPMKKRYAEVQQCFAQMQAIVAAHGREIEIRAKQLYHDREEITVFAQER